MNCKKYVKLAAMIALVAAFAVGGTMAYLQDKTEEVKNSFTFSDDDSIEIDLTEETFGTPGNEAAVSMVPGCNIAKDPQISVTGDDCYIYVDVKESCGVQGKEFADFITYSMTGDWKEVTAVTNPAGTKTYVYTAGGTQPVSVDDTIEDLYLLTDNKVSVKETVTGEMLEAAKTGDTSLTFVGYALQADQVAPGDANNAFIEAFKTSAP